MKALTGLLILFLSFQLMAEVSTQPIPVTVKKFEAVAIEVVANAPAEVIVNNRPDISAEISARVISIDVLEGDVITSGQQLMQLDCSKIALARDVAQASLNQSNARLNFSRSQLQRANNLKKKKSISEELLDQRSTELKEATANQLTQASNFEQAQIDFEHCSISAPFDAVVTNRLVSEGSYVVPGTPVISLLRLNDAEVEAQLRQQEVESIKVSQSVWLEINNKRHPVTLRTVLPEYESLTKTARAKLVFEHNDDIWPGIDARLFWATDRKQLPAELIVRRNGKLGVFSVQDNKAVFNELESAVEGRSAKVDFEPGFQIVDEGRHRLNHGDPVSVMPTAQ
jgi:RND family efflux transporter MFP subunit